MKQNLLTDLVAHTVYVSLTLSDGETFSMLAGRTEEKTSARKIRGKS